MWAFRNLVVIALAAVSPPAMAADLGASATNPDGALGYSLAELHAALPNIPEYQLPSIVFRIPTIDSIMQAFRAAHPIDANKPEGPNTRSVN